MFLFSISSMAFYFILLYIFNFFRSTQLLFLFFPLGEMGTLQGPVICPTVRAKEAGVYTLPVSLPLKKTKIFRSGFWGFRGNCGGRTKAGAVPHQLHTRKCKTLQCSFSSSSDGNGSMAENFNENDEDYVNSSVVEAGMLSLLIIYLFFRFHSDNCSFIIMNF